jgi:hypothetical protein
MNTPASTPDDDRRAQARTLLQAPAALSALIAFTRRFDPSQDLRVRWGDSFEPRRDGLVQKSREMLAIGSHFPGSQEEVLLCMAFCVETAPYLGTSTAAVDGYLRGMLREFVANR